MGYLLGFRVETSIFGLLGMILCGTKQRSIPGSISTTDGTEPDIRRGITTFNMSLITVKGRWKRIQSNNPTARRSCSRIVYSLNFQERRPNSYIRSGTMPIYPTPGPTMTVLNDTDVRGCHFGCYRVMSNIKMLSEQYGLKLCGTVAAGTPSICPSMRRAIQDADIVMINGEGTLHHGRRRARWLINAIEYAKSRNKPVALVNALYQDNPESWNPVVSELDIVCARDALSAAQLSAATGRKVDYMGDLALYHEAFSSPERTRSGTLFGDSVYIRTTRQLLAAAGTVSRRAPVRVMPITKRYRLPGSNCSAAYDLQTIYSYYCHRKAPRYRKIVSFAASQQAYMEALRGFALSVTGRFHALCFALLTRTPFIAVASNSWKMDAIINDVGLRRERLLPPEALTPELILDNDWSYSDRERAAIDRYFETNRTKTTKLFLSLRSLVNSAPVCKL